MTKALETIIDKHRQGGGNIISLLQLTQETFGYIPKEAIDFFSYTLDIAPSRFYGVATFYEQFHLKPRGRNIITACCGTACHVKGSERLINSARQELKLSGTEEMTEDGEFTLEKVNCVGACSLAPVFIINRKVHGKTTGDKLLKEIRAIRGPKNAE